VKAQGGGFGKKSDTPQKFVSSPEESRKNTRKAERLAVELSGADKKPKAKNAVAATDMSQGNWCVYAV
jgi:hypothetical protein